MSGARGAGRPSIVGVDVGSTHVKAVLLEPGRGVGHVARRPTVTHRGGGGAAYHDPGEIVAAVDATVGECVAARPGAAPAAIGIASMAEAGVGLDRRGRPVGEIGAWFDLRPGGQAAWLEQRIGAAPLFRRTGLRAEPKYTLAKLLWLRAERPAAFRRLRRWAGVAELAAFSLTGALGTNASLACRTLAFDVAARAWDAELLGLAGLTDEQLPAVLPLGAAVGGLTRAAASRLGLPAGTPVTVAGHDHLVGAIAAGVTRPGSGLDSMGSAEATLVVTRAPATDEAVRRAGFSTGCHAVDGVGYVIGGLQSSGALVEWFVDAFVTDTTGGDGLDRDRSGSEGAGGARYARFLELLDRSGPPTGPGPLLVAPYLRGRNAPDRDPDATLAVAGVRGEHGLPELALGLLDGAAYQVRWMFDELEAATGRPLRSIRVIGGGTRNPRWLAAKAALGPRRLDVVQTDEAVALGAALAAGLAGGVFGSLEEAIAVAAPPAERVSAPRAAHDRYEAAYRERWLPWVRGLT